MKVSDIIANKGAAVGTLDQQQTLAEAIEVMHEYSIGSIVITSSRTANPVGIVSQSEITAALYNLGTAALHQCLSGVMRKTALQCFANDSVQNAMTYMTRNRVRHLVAIEDDGRIAGLVSMGDFVAARLKSSEMEADVLRDMARTFALVS